MTLGAAATGARAGTGSCGPGHRRSCRRPSPRARSTEVPFVVFNMARGQQDYFQSTRGGGWGDYRHDHAGAQGHRPRRPSTPSCCSTCRQVPHPGVLVYGDYLIADTNMSVDVTARDYGPLPAKDWALDGRSGAGRAGRASSGPGTSARSTTPASSPTASGACSPTSSTTSAGRRPVTTVLPDRRRRRSWCPFGTSGPFVDYVVDELRADGVRIGSFRPITLWPFPEEALAEADRAVSQGARLRDQRRPDDRRRPPQRHRPQEDRVRSEA